MATASVTTTHESGGLLSQDEKPDRVSGKVGEAEGGTHNQLYKIISPVQAKNTFIRGPLVDSIIQYFEEFDETLAQKPAALICCRPDNDTAGSVEVPVGDAGNTGLAAAPSTAGIPTGSRSVVVKFVKAGAHGTAEYRRSVDGGLSFEAAMVTPATGTPISLAVGVTATFADDASAVDTFNVGDLWTFTINGPTASNASRIVAVEVFQQDYRAYWVHILGAADQAFAVSIDTIVSDMANNFNQPIFAILESRAKTTGESVADYYQAMMDEFDPFISAQGRIGIVVGRGKYIAGGVAGAGGYSIAISSGVGEWRNCATMLSAKMAAGAPNISPGWVERMRSLTFTEIEHWGTGYQDYMDSMHDMRLCVLKQYNNYPGVFIASGKLKSAIDSDFVEIPERRRADKMHRIVHQASMPFLNVDSNVESGSGGIAYLQAQVNAEVAAQMMQKGSAEISSAKIVMDPDKDFAQTKILKAKLAMGVENRASDIVWTTTYVQVGN